MMKWVPYQALAVAVLAVSVAIPPRLAAAQEASPVQVDAVRREEVRQTAPVVGRFVSCRAGEVAARIAGPVNQIRVDVGDRLETGDVIAVLVRDRYAAELALSNARVQEAEAMLAATEAKLALRRQELARLERLRRSPAFSEGQYDDKQQEVTMTRADLAEAQAVLASAAAEQRLAEINFRETEVLAPYDGVVAGRHTEVGAHVNPGDPVVSMLDDQCLEIEADVPRQRASGMTPGLQVAYDTGGEHIAAHVRAVVPDENPLTRTRRARFVPEIPPRSSVVAGQTVTVWLPQEEGRDELSVHKDAVLNRKGKHMVFVVKDGKAEPRVVHLGDAVGSRFVVRDGLADGDLAVVRGNERLRPGQAVRLPQGAGG